MIPTPQPQQELDKEALSDYLFKRAEEHQQRGFWDSSFECLYLVTVMNRGWHWDIHGRKSILKSRPTPVQWTDEEVMKEMEDAFDRGVAAAEETIDMKKHDTAIRKAERERVLCELLAYIHPDSRAGCVIKEKLESLRGEP